MKESWLMEKIKFKKGVTLIEVIISIFLLFSLIMSFCFVIPKLNSSVYKNKDILTENMFLENSYKIFTSDPYNFKTNLRNIYDIYLIENEITNTMFQTIDISYYENNLVIGVKIFYNSEEIERWERKKVIQ